MAALQRQLITSAVSSEALKYSDDYIKDILSSVKTIAMVGASTQWNRPSYFAMKYLQTKGYRVIPVNPVAKGQNILGEVVYGTLKEIPSDVQIDMVDIFRASEAAAGVVEEAMSQMTPRGISVIWMQLGVINKDAAARATSAGLKVVMDRCPKIEYSRLFRELGQHGFDSQVISSKKRPMGRPGEAPAWTPKGDRPVFSGFETRSVHAGAAPDPSTGARVTPIHQNTSYVFDNVDHAASLFNLSTFGNIYSRLSNPTVSALEERLANMEGGRGATCTSSGHAAQIVTLFALMQPGSTIVASNKLYGGSITQFGKTIKKFGWNCIFVDVGKLKEVEEALKDPSVRLLFVESLANPGGVVSDLSALSQLAKNVAVPFVVDNTLATPFLCKPIDYGADIVVHSTTKFLSGQGSALGGVVIDSGKFDWAATDKFPSLGRPEPAYHGLTFSETFGDLAFTMFSHAVGLRDLGSTMAPLHAWLTLNGCETLPVRMERQCNNAMAVAMFLQSHSKVAWVSHAGLPSSPFNSLARKYLRGGMAGAVFTFGVKGGFEAGVRVVEAVELFSHLANVGDSRSLILHPASTTHRQLTDEQRAGAGAGDDVIRLSIGLETAEDLIADLAFALEQV
jgi:O-acetylhomoserine (thiol)-lyase